jgi:hypothetical protein
MVDKPPEESKALLVVDKESDLYLHVGWYNPNMAYEQKQVPVVFVYAGVHTFEPHQVTDKFDYHDEAFITADDPPNHP